MATRNPVSRLPSLTTLFIAVLSLSIAMVAGLGIWSLATGGAIGQSLGTVALGGAWYALVLRPRYERLP